MPKDLKDASVVKDAASEIQTTLYNTFRDSIIGNIESSASRGFYEVVYTPTLYFEKELLKDTTGSLYTALSAEFTGKGYALEIIQSQNILTLKISWG